MNPASPDDRADAGWQAGEQMLQRGDSEGAIVAFEANLSRAPGHVQTLLALSAALSRKGRHRRPRQLVVQAHDAVPDVAQLLFAVSLGLYRFNEFARLKETLARPVFRAEAPPRILAEAAAGLVAAGDTASAMQLVERALQIDPGCAAALYFRGNLRSFGGDTAGARADYLACLDSDPRMFQASWMLTGLRTATPGDNRVDRLLREATEAVPGGHGECFVRYALYKEANDLGRHQLAWQSLERACQIGKRTSRFDRDRFTRLVDRMLATFDARMLARQSTVRLASTPVFIVGMFRSGTTLLERILAGHSVVTDGGETYAFAEEVRTEVDRGFDGAFDVSVLDGIDCIDLDAIATRYSASAAWLSKGRAMFTEKLPSNFMNVGLIAMALPRAKIIHIRRDPMDTCFANLTTLFSGAVDHANDQHDVAAYYNGYARLMRHWEALLPDRVLTLDYRALVEDPASHAMRIAEYCGLDYEPGMLDVGRAGGSIATASTAQVRQGILRGRSGAWRPYAAHLQPMLRDLGVPVPAVAAGNPA
ncbi:sulfotransferase [Luteimonas sp. MC1825]|uniref:tetratricopeptide repeat-containing sulfotransferase family protein n=1 Tax=Luteimonas sp. MC1825 TaxID=2761107 RepID=UPI00161761EB|nr:sulfotransferase [Luteimonas sp. MC1825]MBB6598513.1 sulfotransferase [Luteimonas sp. MC1825]QOC88701.1 sulfotransferase [Luteimonas sp. MC1825]